MSTDWAEWSREAVSRMESRNQAWVARFGLQGAAYTWSLEPAELRFERPGGTVAADLCLIGTLSASEGTFRWAWANDAIPPAARRGLEAVPAFGERHDLPRLTTAEWPGTRADGLEMLAVSGRILDSEGGFVDQEGDLTLFFTLGNLGIRP